MATRTPRVVVARGTHGMMQGVGPTRGNAQRRLGLLRRMRVGSLDDMAEREMAKQQQRSKQGKFTSAKKFDELVKAMPDPAGEQDGLLADGAWFCFLGCFLFVSVLSFSGRETVQRPELSQVPWRGTTPGLPLQLWDTNCGVAPGCHRSGGLGRGSAPRVSLGDYPGRVWSGCRRAHSHRRALASLPGSRIKRRMATY